MESWIALEHDTELMFTCSDSIVSRNITGYETPLRHEGLHLFFQTTHAQLITTITNSWREAGRRFGELWADFDTEKQLGDTDKDVHHLPPVYQGSTNF